ncbi:MAG: hypothetical protein ACAH17_02850 [Candidatus Paceibacterota bacterium]
MKTVLKGSGSVLWVTLCFGVIIGLCVIIKHAPILQVRYPEISLETMVALCKTLIIMLPITTLMIFYEIWKPKASA